MYRNVPSEPVQLCVMGDRQLQGRAATASVQLMPPSRMLREPPKKSSRVRFRVLAFLCVLSFLTYYDRQCIVRAQEDIQHSLDISDEQLGLVIGAFWLAYAIFEIPGGWMGDVWGSRFTITRIVIAWSLFTALTGVATGFISLIAFRFLFGVGEAARTRIWPAFKRVGFRFPSGRRSGSAVAHGAVWRRIRANYFWHGHTIDCGVSTGGCK